VAKHIGIPFVGMKWLKIAVRGIVKYVGPAEIGENGTVKNVTGAPMGSPFLAKVVAGESVNLLMINKDIVPIPFFSGQISINCVLYSSKTVNFRGFGLL
jgi:hypothetical protein